MTQPFSVPNIPLSEVIPKKNLEQILKEWKETFEDDDLNLSFYEISPHKETNAIKESLFDNPEPLAALPAIPLDFTEPFVRLSAVQVWWLVTCTNPYERTSIAKVAQQHGFDLRRHQQWLSSNAIYARAYHDLTMNNVSGIEGEIVRKAAADAAAGVKGAIATYSTLRTAMKATKQNTDIERILELVQKGAPDQNAIAGVIKALEAAKEEQR